MEQKNKKNVHKKVIIDPLKREGIKKRLEFATNNDVATVLSELGTTFKRIDRRAGRRKVR